MRERLAAVGLAWGLVACGPSTQDMQLGKASSVALSITGAGPRDALSPSELLVQFGAPANDCQRAASETKVVVNGQAVSVTDRGGGGMNFDGASVCFPASANVPMRSPDEAQTEVVLQDNTGRSRAVFQALNAPRTISLPGGTLLHPGDEVVVEWQPATDVLDAQRLQVDLGPADGGRFVSGAEGPITLEGNRIHFRVAAPEPGVQPGILSVLGDGHAGVTACENLSACEADVIARLDVPITWATDAGTP